MAERGVDNIAGTSNKHVGARFSEPAGVNFENMTTLTEILIEKNKSGVIKRLCTIIETTANESIDQNGTFYIGLSGGSLATFLTQGLPSIKTDFSKWKLFFCDERVVPEDDPDSTYGLYKKSFIDSGAVDLKEDQFVTIKQGVGAEEAAIDYADKLVQYFPNVKVPNFDMLLLGMGPDGHTCSLFPGHPLLQVTDKWIAAITDSPKPPPGRVTMTFPVVNNARVCVFAMTGKAKADMLKRIWVDKEDLPAGRVNPIGGKLYWIVDEEAGTSVKL